MEFTGGGTRILIIHIIHIVQIQVTQKISISNLEYNKVHVNAIVKYILMETPSSSIESLFEKVEVYGKTTYELSKLKLLETTNTIVVSLIARLGVIVMISMFSFVLSIAVALLLGDMLGKAYYGFFIVSGFYLVSGLVLHFFLLRWIKKPISELIIKQALQ
jgi:hypothetical protein